MQKVPPPAFEALSFACPFCGAFSQMNWQNLAVVYMHDNGQEDPRYTAFHTSKCWSCSSQAVWLVDDDIPFPGEPQRATMIYPNRCNAPAPHPELPDKCKADFEEARQIANVSPRGAAALLRLTVQKLCIELGTKGKNINEDIGKLVEMGLPIRVQRALDVVRVVGNNAVHPGELSPDDHATQVASLFELVNLIVDYMFAQPKRIDAMYEGLPKGALDGIQRRDDA